MNELAVINGLKKSEEWAVETLIEQYGDRLLRSAYAVCGDRHLAEEVVQDVFLTVCRKIDSFRGNSSLYTWMYRITVNRAKNKMRSKWFRKVSPQEDLELKHPLEFQSPEEMAVKKECSMEIFQSLSSLPAIYRQVIDLYYIQEFNVREMADVLKISEGTVKSRLARARNRLHNLLKERWKEQDEKHE